MKRVHIVAGALSLLTLAVGGAAIAQTGSASAAPAAGTCQVTVDRSQAAGSFRVDKQTLENGSCVCYVYTGPTTQEAATEQKVAAVQSSGDCDTPPETAAAAPSSGSRVPLYIGGAVGVGALIAVLATDHNNHNDSTGG